MNKAKNICVICFYICYATVPALPYIIFLLSEVW